MYGRLVRRLDQQFVNVDMRRATRDPDEDFGNVLSHQRLNAFIDLLCSGGVASKTDEGKLGKHFFEQKNIRYEPKIMAEAIRTMIARDKE